MLLNMMRPICAKAAAITKLGIRNAAIADAAKLGYESVGHVCEYAIQSIRKLKKAPTCNIIQHGKVQQGIHETQHCSRCHRAPERSIPVACERKPEQANWESPHSDHRNEKPRFRAALASSLQAVTLEKVCLDWHESKHDGDTDDQVQVRQVCSDIADSTSDIEFSGAPGVNVREPIVHYENIEYSIQVEKQQTIRKAVIHSKKHNNRFRYHDPESHGADKSEFLQDIDLGLDYHKLIGVDHGGLSSFSCNDNPRQGLRDETHANSKGRSDDGAANEVSLNKV